MRFLVRPLVATALATRTSGSERCRLGAAWVAAWSLAEEGSA